MTISRHHVLARSCVAVLGLALVATLAPGSTASTLRAGSRAQDPVTGQIAAIRDAPEVMGYALQGAATPATLTRDGDLVDTVGVSGVALTRRGRVEKLSPKVIALRNAARGAGKPPVLLFSNYSNVLGDFDEPRAYRMLKSPRKRALVARLLARRAAGFSGVQIDLESLRRRDRRGLVKFTRALRRALPKGRTVSMAFMASTDARGYAERGYRLTKLSKLLDVAVLMTYDQHGPWSGPGPISSLPWVRSQLNYFLTRVPRSKVDVGAAAYGYRWGGGAPQLTVPRARALAGSRATWSPLHGEWHATLPGGRTLWWDDARSVDLRRQLAAEKGLHGVAIWELGGSGRLTP